MTATTSSANTSALRGSLAEVELLLRNRPRFFAEVRDALDLPRKITSLLLWTAIFLAVTGAVIGSKHSLWQAMASSFKLPLLFLLTLLVCLPTLYFFNTIFESSLSLSQVFAVILSAITITAIVLLALMPVMLFFMITTGEYQFFKLLNVAIFTIAGAMGLLHLVHGMRVLNLTDRRGLGTRQWILRAWLLLYAFVGSQLAWTLRPFFGAPETPFELFRGLGGNFYANVFQALGEVFGFWIVR